MPGQPAAPAAGGGVFSTFGFVHFVQRKQAGKPACFLPCIGRWQGAGTPASFVDAKRRQRSQRPVLVRFCGKASLCALR